MHWHRPAVHVLPPVHAFPHAPQLVLSDVRSTHPPAQAESPVVHVAVQTPEVQSGMLPLQAVPHLPQLAALVVKSTHLPLHNVVPAGQTHVPALEASVAVELVQNVPPVHLVPHMPQLALSELRSTHAPLQLVVPATQPAELHMLFEQVCVFPQALPHTPQLPGSLAVVTQATPASVQDIWPAGQVQFDATQLLPPAHVMAHWPQLFGSVPSETQFPLQLVSPGPHPPSVDAASASLVGVASDESSVAIASPVAVASPSMPDWESCAIVASLPPPSAAESREDTSAPPSSPPPMPLELSPPHPATFATSAHPVSTRARQLHRDPHERMRPPRCCSFPQLVPSATDVTGTRRDGFESRSVAFFVPARCVKLVASGTHCSAGW